MTAPALEFRRAASPSAAGRRLAGVAVRYGAVADLGRFRERIAPGAFAGSIEQRADILALLDHDPGKVLARTRSGSLRIADGADALRYELDVPDTSAGRDALALAERGDLGGVSFAMIVEDEAREGGVRVVKRAKLFEITIVSAWPAYEATTVEARRRRQGFQDLHLSAYGDATSGEARLGADITPGSAGVPPRLAALKRYLETL